jgi:hypothetical protein
MRAHNAVEWLKAMEFKLNALKKLHVWEETQLPENTIIIAANGFTTISIIHQVT